jgi:hypothetical protein
MAYKKNHAEVESRQRGFCGLATLPCGIGMYHQHMPIPQGTSDWRLLAQSFEDYIAMRIQIPPAEEPYGGSEYTIQVWRFGYTD